jgi:hypothetical protein
MRRHLPDGPLTVTLERLRRHDLPYRWHEHDLKVWEAVCPACRFGDYSLRIREPFRDAPVSLLCGWGCSDAEIRTALEREPVEPQIHAALELAERASTIAAEALEILEVTR